MSSTCPQFTPITMPQYNTHHTQALLSQQQQQWMAKMHVACSQAKQIPIINRKHLTIIDWDDTILPTTALFRTKQIVSDSVLEACGKAIYSFLYKLIQVYSANNVYIVTNAQSGWCSKSMELLSKRQRSGTNYWIHIHHLLSSTLSGHAISAQAAYSTLYPEQTTTWKVLTFRQLALEHFGRNFHGECTLISIGDSYDEFIAAMETKKMLQSQYGMEPVHLIRMRLSHRPSISAMMAQYPVINAAIDVTSAEIQRKSVDIDIADFI